MAPREQFEIRVQVDSRWQIHSVVPREKEALTRAETLLDSGHYEAVEVVRDRMTSGGLSNEKVIFSQTSTKRVEKKINVTPIDDAPVCETAEQVFEFEGRRTIGKLLREFLESMLLSPTELLHTHRALVKLNDADALLPSAIDRVARIQAHKTGAEVKERSTRLYKLFEQVLDRARRTDIIDMKSMTFAELIKAVEKGVPVEGRRHAVMTALTKRLSSAMIWDGKLEILLDLIAEPELPPWSAALLDSLIAEMLDLPAVMRELLGKQPDLGGVLNVLIGLTRGSYAPQKWDPPNLHTLARTMAEKPMPACRTVLGEWVARELGSRRPLTRGNARDEETALRALLEQVLDGYSFVGGRETLNAFTRRFSRNPEQGMEAKGTEETLQALLGVIDQLVNPVYTLHAQIRCLLDVSKTEFGRDNANTIALALGERMGRVNEIYDLTYYRLPVKKRMAEISDLQKLALECTMPGGLNRVLAERLDEIFCKFLVNEQIIEKLDMPEDSLNARANRLLQFCASGILTEGNAHRLAGEAVLRHLRQPNFIEKYTEGAPDAAAKEAMIRQLHRLIAAAGVQM